MLFTRPFIKREQACGSEKSRVTGENDAVAADQNGVDESEFSDREGEVCDLLELCSMAG